jgi:hypothetical protein
MHGAAVATRAHILACQGFFVPPAAARIEPRSDI